MGVDCHIEKLLWDFLWSGITDEFKYHLVSWRCVCKPLQNGGLGIRNLVLFNQALLGSGSGGMQLTKGLSRGGWCNTKVCTGLAFGIY